MAKKKSKKAKKAAKRAKKKALGSALLGLAGSAAGQYLPPGTFASDAIQKAAKAGQEYLSPVTGPPAPTGVDYANVPEDVAGGDFGSEPSSGGFLSTTTGKIVAVGGAVVAAKLLKVF